MGTFCHFQVWALKFLKPKTKFSFPKSVKHSVHILKKTPGSFETELGKLNFENMLFFKEAATSMIFLIPELHYFCLDKHFSVTEILEVDLTSSNFFKTFCLFRTDEHVSGENQLINIYDSGCGFTKLLTQKSF